MEKEIKEWGGGAAGKGELRKKGCCKCCGRVYFPPPLVSNGVEGTSLVFPSGSSHVWDLI